MSAVMRVAVVGASGLVGEATIDALGRGEPAIATLHALASERSLGKHVTFAGRSLPIGVLADFDFAQADLALFAVDEAVAGEHVPRALAAGCRVIDCSSRFHDDPAVPLWLPADDELPEAVRAARLVALPGPAAAALAAVLRPLQAVAGIARADLVVLEAVSGAGRAGVEELAQQTALLLNGRSVAKPRVFRRQVAFNCVPEIGGVVPGEPAGEEAAIASQLRRLLGEAQLAITVTAVTVPVFFGHSAAVHLQLARALDADRARALLARTAGLKVVDTARGARLPTAATEAIDSAEVLVGRIRTEPGRDGSLAFWVVADNVRAVAANHVARAAQILVKGVS